MFSTQDKDRRIFTYRVGASVGGGVGYLIMEQARNNDKIAML